MLHKNGIIRNRYFAVCVDIFLGCLFMGNVSLLETGIIDIYLLGANWVLRVKAVLSLHVVMVWFGL